ncbi:hypothetical protein J0X19_09570 [Hymenobacter sp. BT186]|uniref:Uncharacterized protein n=1 Tax=Hymenobacter telluris TaxID=2816474 RepID=A0A939EW94_9BACT|nr:hypothetical protein [Hymenobacter telluris]MBO0358191.1 hypothetical protein [Hymenobacter telluris]
MVRPATRQTDVQVAGAVVASAELAWLGSTDSASLLQLWKAKEMHKAESSVLNFGGNQCAFIGEDFVGFLEKESANVTVLF